MGGESNLRPFTKGDPRINRKGQPRKLPSLDKLLVEVLGDENDPDSEISKILKALTKRAVSKYGDRAAEILLDRAFGKPKQQMDINIPAVVKSFKIVGARERTRTGDTSQ